MIHCCSRVAFVYFFFNFLEEYLNKLITKRTLVTKWAFHACGRLDDASKKRIITKTSARGAAQTKEQRREGRKRSQGLIIAVAEKGLIFK